MSSTSTAKPLRFLFENSIFLIAGAVAGLVWANAHLESYTYFKTLEIFGTGHAEAAGLVAAGDGGAHAHPIDITFLVNDVLMAFFFAIAGKEVWEALLPGGPLSNFRKASMPLIATLGGIVGPAAFYIGGCFLLDQWEDLGRGWAIPCATDIAFSYLVARMIFGARHVAIPFLLLLAIADDAAGLVIIAVGYSDGVKAEWLLLTAAAILIGLAMRRLKVKTFWAYLLLPGILSWFSFYKAGIHAALGLVPIIPCLPHAHTDLGLFMREELKRDDTLNAFEHWFKNPVELFLGLFGLVNAGVVFSAAGAGTWLVLIALLVGKPIGVTLFVILGQKVFRLELPRGMNLRHVIVVGTIAGIGFTVALFVTTAAFKTPGPIQDAAKMGALASFGAAILSFLVAGVLRVRKAGDDAAQPANAGDINVAS